MELRVEGRMTGRSLNANRRRLVDVIEHLGFGCIKRLSIRDGETCDEPALRIVQEIKLDSERSERDLWPDSHNSDLTLKKSFAVLFSQLLKLEDGVVDIEVRHSAPLRLVIERSYEEPLW
jgi:hypothetical protein